MIVQSIDKCYTGEAERLFAHSFLDLLKLQFIANQTKPQLQLEKDRTHTVVHTNPTSSSITKKHQPNSSSITKNLPSLKLTFSPMKIGRAPKGN